MSDTAAPPRRQLRTKTVARLSALTKTAGELALRDGLSGISLDALIAQAGGSRRNVYLHFGGKDGLFLEAVRELCAKQAAPLSLLRVNHPSQRGVDAVLRSFGTQLLGLVLQPETLALHRLMIAEGARYPELAATIWKSGHQIAGETLRPWIEEQQSAGRLKEGPSSSIAAQFVDMVTSRAQLRALSGMAVPAGRQIDTIVNEAVATFLHGWHKKQKLRIRPSRPRRRQS